MTQLPTQPIIGFIGLGNMGGRMARCLVQAGHTVLGYDTRIELNDAAGSQPTSSVGELAARADVILMSLPESKIVEAVVLGEAGVLHHSKPGQILVDLSTSAPSSTRELSKEAATRGVAFIDAGISGGAAAADKGALTLMVGGDDEQLSAVRPILETFSSKIFHCGDVGTGHTAKLLNNFLNAIALSATSEVMVAATKAGLDRQVLLEVLNASSGVNFATTNRFPSIVRGDYLEGGLTNALMLKDVLAYVALTSELGVATPNSAGPLASFGIANQLGYATTISNHVVDALGDISGGVRIQATA
ncbi:3-hydroxyisobutyrate dehydrogenase [Rhodococcus sp. 06-621-2]|nr:NAD(P)-dependent oxidoreductase [Rhodococcus sp. 06-621-2]OZC59763.1 3-hydroxyisobutyrate dehydrogenase [Rhodococcus sp. 06-621-2]